MGKAENLSKKIILNAAPVYSKRTVPRFQRKYRKQKALTKYILTPDGMSKYS
jgi:hypothetical protein